MVRTSPRASREPARARSSNWANSDAAGSGAGEAIARLRSFDKCRAGNVMDSPCATACWAAANMTSNALKGYCSRRPESSGTQLQLLCLKYPACKGLRQRFSLQLSRLQKNLLLADFSRPVLRFFLLKDSRGCKMTAPDSAVG